MTTESSKFKPSRSVFRCFLLIVFFMVLHAVFDGARFPLICLHEWRGARQDFNRMSIGLMLLV